MVGMLEEALAEQGLSLRPAIFNDLLQVHLQPAGSDVYLGTFEVSPGHAGGDFPEMVTYYVQSHGSGVQGLDPAYTSFVMDSFMRLVHLVLSRHTSLQLIRKCLPGPRLAFRWSHRHLALAGVHCAGPRASPAPE